jgi:methylated-DNA-[protein]-cysteine S-methyltransferase
MKNNSPHKIVSANFLENTPAGSLALAATESGLARLFFCTKKDYDAFLNSNQLSIPVKENLIILEASKQIIEYFEGKRKEFKIPLDLQGQSPFREKVLKTCARIPFGNILTYKMLAEKAGSPRAARAAGGAMANNPIALIIPCHRVVGSDRGLHGFSSPGGLKTKAILLRHEGVEIENERVSREMR